jgi:hypothetical protein
MAEDSGPWTTPLPERGGEVVSPGAQAVGPPEVACEPGGGVDVEWCLVELAITAGKQNFNNEYTDI